MSGLNLIRLRLDLPRLYELAKRRNLPTRDVDLGYLVHCQLGELIREAPPKLFALPALNHPDPKPGHAIEVLAYSTEPGDKLVGRAQAFSTPEHWEVLLDGRIDSKPMPGIFPAGTTLGFEVRACPVVRTKSKKDGTRTESGERELDVFLLEVEKHPETKPGTLDKRAIYEAWLQARFGASSGASLESVALTALRRERVVRREKGGARKARAFDRPDVVFRGLLRVTDPEKFQAFLAHGIGRHRAFGFGMLLLLPASEV